MTAISSAVAVEISDRDVRRRHANGITTGTSKPPLGSAWRSRHCCPANSPRSGRRCRCQRQVCGGEANGQCGCREGQSPAHISCSPMAYSETVKTETVIRQGCIEVESVAAIFSPLWVLTTVRSRRASGIENHGRSKVCTRAGQSAPGRMLPDRSRTTLSRHAVVEVGEERSVRTPTPLAPVTA